MKSPDISSSNIPVAREPVLNWCINALEASTVPSKDARIVAEALVATSLWGIDSHGISRLPHYLNRISKGSIKPQPKISFTRTAAAAGTVDGDHGLGIVICTEATDHAITIARESGIGAVGVNNSSHCGAIGLYTRQIAKAGLIGMGFTHSDSFVVPYHGKRAFFGTNPISIAFPTDNAEEPLCVDMATSIVPWNRIMNARRDNKAVPLGWGVDENGNETTDPHAIRAVKPMADHKGFALAFLIDMLCGPLNGMPFGTHIPKMYDNLDQHRRLGSFFIAIDFTKFGAGKSMPSVISTAMMEVKAEGHGILFPGEPEYVSHRHRTRDGIPVEPGLLEEIQHWSERLEIPGLTPA